MKAKTIHITPADDKIFGLVASERKTSVKAVLDGIVADAALRLRDGDESVFDRIEEIETQRRKAVLESKMQEMQAKIAKLNTHDQELY